MPSRTSKSHKTSTLQSSALGQNYHREQLKQSRSTLPATTTDGPKLIPSTSQISCPPPNPQPPPNWPSNLPYLSHPVLSPYLPPTHLKWLRTRPNANPGPEASVQTQSSSNNITNDDPLPVIPFPLSQQDIESRVSIRVIDDPRHPAHGQRGLFATRDLVPGELVVVYLGYVHGATSVERGELERHRKEQGQDRGVGERDAKVKTESETKSDEVITGGSEVESALNANPHCNDTTSASVTGPESPTEVMDLTDEKAASKKKESTVAIGSWDTSSYDLNMYRSETIELAVDAAKMGNEARFVNDYRGVPVFVSDRVQQGDELDREDRRGKRKFKVKTTIVQDQFAAAGYREEQIQTQTQRGSTGDGEEWQKYNNENIAMPNAEFRDVWFDMTGNGDLTEKLFGDTGLSDFDAARASVSTPARASKYAQGRHRNSELPMSGSTSADSPVPAVSSLETPNLSKPPRNHNAQHSSTPSDSIHTNPSRPPPPRRRRRPGMRGVAIFVMPAGKSGKRKGGIKKGQEILVSYGKGFWAHHGSEI